MKVKLIIFNRTGTIQTLSSSSLVGIHSFTHSFLFIHSFNQLIIQPIFYLINQPPDSTTHQPTQPITTVMAHVEVILNLPSLGSLSQSLLCSWTWARPLLTPLRAHVTRERDDRLSESPAGRQLSVGVSCLWPCSLSFAQNCSKLTGWSWIIGFALGEGEVKYESSLHSRGT